MDHQWRPMQEPPPPPPPYPSNICPTCSFPHFPFCPPYPPPPHQFPPQPPPPPPPPNYPRPDPYYSGMPSEYVPRNPSFDYGGGYGPPVYDYYHNAYYADGEAGRSYKRPRVDEMGVLGHQNSYVPERTASDHERRLKLIRDHGGGGVDAAVPLVDGSLTGNNLFRHDATNIYSPFTANNEPPPPPHGAPYSYHHHHQPPPLPPTPPPPPPVEPPPSSPPKASLFPVPIGANLGNPSLKHKEEWRTSGQVFATKQLSPEKPMIVDAVHLFKQPHRPTRPDRVVVILRGLPGSGKSYLAKRMRDLEVENGGDAPRIHSMDDYFMTEVEKVDESDGRKSMARGKKPTVKKVMEYCYEPEMEEVYRESMLKAFKKTLEEGNFTFVIVDDRNLRVADFAQFWAIAKRSGYEAYLLEAAYKDPAGCAARNVHGFTLDEVEKMAGQWEEAPFLYLRLDIMSLFRGDDLKESGIQEVDMDAEDEELDKDTSSLPERMPEGTTARPVEDDDSLALSKDEKQWDADEDHPLEEVKELGKSKWSEDLDEDETEGSEGLKGNVNALSGLIQAYGSKRKSVHWSDQVGNRGFSISAAKRANMVSLVIGPGSGYNLKSNPLPEEENPGSAQSNGKLKKKKSVFQERLRAERESFKLVFDRRRQRIGDLDVEDDYK